MSDKEQVRDAGIQSAIVVDDGYDEVPQVEELLDEGAWNSFFDDAQGAAATRIQAIFPEYDPGGREELKSSQDFVDVLWRERDNIRDLLGELFDLYEQKIRSNRPFLDAVEAALTELSIPFETLGRDFIKPAIEADLIVVDLFLGIQQGNQDREFTVNRLKEMMKQRRAESSRPLPSIILMSQVTGIKELAKEFRQEVKLHASSFRHIKKDDLAKPGRMKGLVLTLASHRSDSQALANFVETWEKKAVEAVDEAAGTLRKVDIDDLQHIRSMLLRFEGINTSSYMLDVFDRVLQYEIESHSAVLDAAVLLDEVADDPAPLMISNDRDTYAVLEQTLFVNPKRRAHATGAAWPMAFGDILGPRPGELIRQRGFFSGRDDLVFFVASPECDLIRKDGLTTVLLVAGFLKEIDMAKPGLAVTSKTTPVITLEQTRRYQVEWDFGDLRTITLGQAKRLLHPDRGDMTIIARLREGPALSLRQQLLSNVGRVGELAPLPRSLQFRANLHLPIQRGKTQPIQLPDGVEVTGNILMPRSGKYGTAIIDSNCEDDLTELLLDLDLANVPVRSQKRLNILKEQTRIRQMFRSGLQIEIPVTTYRTAGLLKLNEEQPSKDSAKPRTDPVATIVNGEAGDDGLKDVGQDAGLVVQVFLESN